jgi:ABC-2 type transport system ATP-binding protein
VLVEGEPVYENPGKKALIAAIPDDWYHFPSATIADMMRFYRGFYPAFDMARYEKFKEVFALPEKSPIRRMSKGMQKQAAFWLTMCCRPRYLILDEPVDGLDPVMRRQVWSLMMSDVSEHGTTVLVSSHNLRELEDVCDHVGIMNKGRVLLERSLSDLQDNIVKLQAVWRTGEVPVLPGQLQVLHTSHVGRVYTYIVRGRAEDVTGRLEQFKPLMLEALPLSLEEIFIYELGGEQYAVKEIIL